MDEMLLPRFYEYITEAIVSFTKGEFTSGAIPLLSANSKNPAESVKASGISATKALVVPAWIHIWFQTVWDQREFPGRNPDAHYHERVHSRHNFKWRNRVHERPYWTSQQERESMIWCKAAEMQEHPERTTKSRSSYLPLLRQAVAEDAAGALDGTTKAQFPSTPLRQWKLVFFLIEELMEAKLWHEAAAQSCLLLDKNTIADVWENHRQLAHSRLVNELIPKLLQ
jgi:hypothetical protein